MTTKPSPANEHLPFLDYLRGIAILSVFCFHSVGATFGATDQLVWKGCFRDFHVSHLFLTLVPFTLGWSGVTLFFVISGFCIHLSHERSRDKSLKVFFIRRFFRIYPPYLIAAVIFALCRLDFHHQIWVSSVDLAIHLALLNNFLPGPGGINGAFWSIAVEVQLYLLYPVLLLIAQRCGWRKTMSITGTIWALMLFTQLTVGLVYPGFVMPQAFLRSPFIYWYIWTIGAALADAYLKGEPLPFRKQPFYLWLAMALIAYFFKPLSIFTNTAFALAAAHLIALCLERPDLISMSRLAPVFKPVGAVGLISYSAYLLHQPMMKMLILLVLKICPQHYLPHSTIFALAFSSLLIILPISYAYYRLIELPSIELGKWVIQKRRKVMASETKTGAVQDKMSPM